MRCSSPVLKYSRSVGVYFPAYLSYQHLGLAWVVVVGVMVRYGGCGSGGSGSGDRGCHFRINYEVVAAEVPCAKFHGDV